MTETLADLYETRYGEKTDLGKDRPAEGEIARQLAHRSHRRWADKPVDDELLQLLFAALFAYLQIAEGERTHTRSSDGKKFTKKAKKISNPRPTAAGERKKKPPCIINIIIIIPEHSLLQS